MLSYNNRASTKAIIGDVEGAFEDINKALQINPDYILGNLNRGQLKSEMGDIQSEQGNIDAAKRYYQEAIDDLTKTLTLNPKQRLARSSLKRADHKLKLL